MSGPGEVVPVPGFWHRFVKLARCNFHNSVLYSLSALAGLVPGGVYAAGNGEHSRNTEMWIAFQDNDRLGHQPWDTPFARVPPPVPCRARTASLVETHQIPCLVPSALQVIEGMENVDGWYSGYGDAQEFGGNAPDKYRMYTEGSAYVRLAADEALMARACTLPHAMCNQEEVVREMAAVIPSVCIRCPPLTGGADSPQG